MKILLLLIPTIAEIINDRFGETLKDKRNDVWMRGFLMLSIAAAHATTWKVYVAQVLLSIGFFVLLFDYLINIVLRKPNWFTYLSDSPTDKRWKSWNPWLRFGIRVVFFLSTLLLYTLWI